MENTSNPNEGILEGLMKIGVYYEDTDLSGFVYHSNYLKYCERAREHVIGVQFLRDLYHDGLHFVVSKASLTYRAPAGHGDELIVKTRGTYSRSPAIPFDQSIYKMVDGREVLVVEAQITIVALNMDHRPIRIPDEVIRYFQQYVVY